MDKRERERKRERNYLVIWTHMGDRLPVTQQIVMTEPWIYETHVHEARHELAKIRMVSLLCLMT